MTRFMRGLVREIQSWVSLIIRNWPGRLGFYLRQNYVRKRFRSAGENLWIEPGVVITGHENITLGSNFSIMRNSALYAHDGAPEIGNDVSINSNTMIAAADEGRISIGDKVIIGPNVVIRASDHAHESADKPIRDKGHTGGSIVIEDDVWVASNCVILRNLRIGAHSIVAAGGVVTKDVEPYSIVAGVPAKLVSYRK